MLTHGGDTYGFVQTYGVEPLDFSVNTNPKGLPPAVREAVIAALDKADLYPDPLCRKLCSAIGTYLQVPAQWVLCGNGAADLIWRIVQAFRPKQALVTAPAFSEYEAALTAFDCHVNRHLLLWSNRFALTEDFLLDITPETDMVFLCNPNNPTGKTIAPELLRQILRRCREQNVLLVLDECFVEFLQDSEKVTLRKELKTHPNLILLRAFTKLYAMAGLRLGYCLCADLEKLSRIGACGQSWAVSVAAQAAGEAALGQREYVADAKRMLSAERARLRDGLEKLGMDVMGGEANYLFFYTDIPDFHNKLAQQGILLRDCANYHGLTIGYYRTAVRLPKENDCLLRAVEDMAQSET